MNPLVSNNGASAGLPNAASALSRRLETGCLPERDFDAWDRFVSGDPQGTIYHLTAWKAFLEEAFPHIRGEILVLRDRTSGEILAGLPLFTVRSLFLGRRIVSTPFATLGGPLVTAPGQWEFLLPPILEHLKDTGSRRLEIRGLRSACPLPAWSAPPLAAHLHHYVQLPKTAGELRRGFSKNVRREIAKAEGSGIEVREDRSNETIRLFSCMYQNTRRRLGLPVFPAGFFESMARKLPGSSVSVLIAERRGVPLGILLNVQFRGWVIGEHIAVTEAGRSMGTNQYLIWRAMETAIGAGHLVYSFGRTAADNAGLLQFKRAWGSVEESLSTLAYPATAPNIRDQAPSSLMGRIARVAFRRLPAPLARTAGRLFYRHWA